MTQHEGFLPSSTHTHTHTHLQATYNLKHQLGCLLDLTRREGGRRPMMEISEPVVDVRVAFWMHEPDNALVWTERGREGVNAVSMGNCGRNVTSW